MLCDHVVQYYSTTTKYYASTTPYCKVPLQYYQVLLQKTQNTTANTQTKNLKTPPQTHQAPFTPGTCYTKHLVHQTPLPMCPCLHLFNSVEAARKDMRPEETFTFRSPTLNKHNHCSQQRHTILLFDFLLSSWPQSAKTYDLKKHVLSDLLHLTNTIIAVRKDIQYSLSIFSCLRIKTHPLQSAKTYDLQKHLLSDLLLHLPNTTMAVRKHRQYCF